MNKGVRGGLVALGAMLAACSSLLGIEDLSTEPADAGAGGTAQSGSGSGANGGKSGSGTGGASANGGKAGDTGKGGNGAAGAGATGGGTSGGGGGSSGSGGGSSGAGGSTGGSSGSGGTDANGGDAGSGTVEPGPVTGTIIDFWGHKISGVPVKIGDASATTDQNGKFTVADVPETYDLALVIQTQSPTAVYEWVYLGLTRRDPTLQVKNAFDYNGAHFYVTQENGNGGDPFDSGFWFLGFGSNDGANSGSEPLTASSTGFDRRPEWFGPSTTSWTLHSLFLDQTAGIPSEYIAYETKTATTDSSDLTEQDFVMDLTPQTIDTGNVSGAIVESSGQGRTNSVYVRFTTGAAIPVVDRVSASASAYQYLVPDLPNGTISVCAAETRNDDSYAIAHRDQRQVGDTGVDLVIPPPVAGLMPPDETVNVGPTTPITFGAGDPENKGYLVRIESESYRQGVFIVTTERELTLDRIPVVGNGLIIKNAWHQWNVETHGKYASVDAMAGPNGFLDPFTLNDHIPQGPSRADGAYTTSIIIEFQTAP
ncbi:MAG TPA: hypothetical protein VFW03_06640 [Gemmatimonadaceae bacterium]|nr:hypothetical protein [Gemmatimonadaceae bacterium]